MRGHVLILIEIGLSDEDAVQHQNLRHWALTEKDLFCSHGGRGVVEPTQGSNFSVECSAAARLFLKPLFFFSQDAKRVFKKDESHMIKLKHAVMWKRQFMLHSLYTPSQSPCIVSDWCMVAESFLARKDLVKLVLIRKENMNGCKIWRQADFSPVKWHK